MEWLSTHPSLVISSFCKDKKTEINVCWWLARQYTALTFSDRCVEMVIPCQLCRTIGPLTLHSQEMRLCNGHKGASWWRKCSNEAASVIPSDLFRNPNLTLTPWPCTLTSSYNTSWDINHYPFWHFHTDGQWQVACVGSEMFVSGIAQIRLKLLIPPVV